MGLSSDRVTVDITEGGLSAPDVERLLATHVAQAQAASPSQSVHALDLVELAAPSVTFYSARTAGVLAGCGALKQLDPLRGEIKSMRTAPQHIRRGVGSRLLEHILDAARRRSYREVLLETGAEDVYMPARRLYMAHGFRPCGPFAEYGDDPNSVYLRRAL